MMWAVAAAFSLLIAIAGHGVLARLPLNLTSIAKFLIAGTLSAGGLALYCLAQWGLSAEFAASLALYAAACELYIFLFTVTSGSISASLLYRLRSRRLSGPQIEGSLGGHAMVERRIKDMLAIGLLQKTSDGYVKTPRGALVLWLYRSLRKFFWRPQLHTVVPRTDPGPLLLALPLGTKHVLQRHLVNGFAWLVLLGMVAAIFWEHFSGVKLFIGDSDRLNHYLTILRILTDGYREGALRTWDELSFGGFDVVSFTHPYPTSLLHLLWPSERLFFAAGVVSALLLAAAGWAAYAFIKDVCEDAFASFVGAGLYMMSALSILTISQNDISFSAFVLIPLVLLITRRIRSDNSIRCFIGLALALTYLLAFAFLQTAAYALMLAASYAAYRAYRTRGLGVIAVFGLATLTSLAASFPRIYSMGEEFFGSARYGGLATGTPQTAAMPKSYEVLRSLDDRIFGPYAAEASLRNASINMHEGFLLYISTFAVFVLAFGLGRKLLARKAERDTAGSEAPFYVTALILCLFVLGTRAGQQVMYHAFLRIDFIHARIGTIALLPLCALVALSLLNLPSSQDTRKPDYVIAVTSLLAAIAAVAGIEVIATLYSAKYIPMHWPGAPAPLFLAASATTRIVLSIGVLLVLVVSWRYLCRLRGGGQFVVYALGFLMLGQVFAYAREQIAGPHTRTASMPFARHVRLLAEPHYFHGPTPGTMAAVQERLDTANYRSSVICDPGRTAIHCSAHISHFWGLRLIDGYLSAVPARLAALPFPKQVLGARVLTFATNEQLPWPLLAMLNVKYAVELSRPLFTNSVALPGGGFREPRIEDLRIVENPIAPAPRLFFAKSVLPVANVQEGAQALFPGGRSPTARVAVEELSYVEGLSAARTFSTAGAIRTRFSHDEIRIDVDVSAQARFLVLNERFHPRWRAYADQAEVPVYPTNVFMRGIVVPPGATALTMRYVPFIYSPAAIACYAGALLLFGFGLLAFRQGPRASFGLRDDAPEYDPAPVAHYSHHRQTGE